MLPIGLCGSVVRLDRGSIEATHPLLADVCDFPQQALAVQIEFVHLPRMARPPGEVSEQTLRQLPRRH